MTAFDASYYDGIHADERSMDAQCDAGEQAVRDSLLPAAMEQAKGELIAECNQTASIARLEWLEYQSEHGPLSARDFVLMNERIGGELVSDRVEAIIEQFVDGMSE